MININEYNIYVCRDNIDFRKSINGLSAIMEYSMQLKTTDKSLFLFRNKSRDKIKILYWGHTEFTLWYKVLEKNKFPWPLKHNDKTICITQKQFEWLLKGIDYWAIKHHENLEIIK